MGQAGPKPSENPYWKLVNEQVLKQLPPPDRQMRAAGLSGRVFPALGNHEVWNDADAEGLLSTFPVFKKIRRFRQAPHLQIRLRRCPLYLPMDWHSTTIVSLRAGSLPGPFTKNR